MTTPTAADELEALLNSLRVFDDVCEQNMAAIEYFCRRLLSERDAALNAGYLSAKDAVALQSRLSAVLAGIDAMYQHNLPYTRDQLDKLRAIARGFDAVNIRPHTKEELEQLDATAERAKGGR